VAEVQTPSTLTSKNEERKRVSLHTKDLKPADEVAKQVMSIMNSFIKNLNISLKLYINPEYINELIYRLVNIIKEQNQSYEYLRRYQNQLCSYVKEVGTWSIK
jgi:hypothetical protein